MMSAFVIFSPSPNWLIDADNHPQEAAARLCLFAGHRQR